MNDEQFIEKINEFVESLNGKTPTDRKIREAFGKELTKEQIGAVRDYVKDVQGRGSLSEEDALYVKEYLKSLPDTSKASEKDICECTSEELVLRYLVNVVDMAKELHEEGLQISEMIAEGNLGLAEAVLDAHNAKDMDAYIRDSIRIAIQEYVDCDKAAKDRDEKIVFQADLLNKTIDNLTREKGVKPNVDELANAMGIPQSKVLDIIKLAGEDEGKE